MAYQEAEVHAGMKRLREYALLEDGEGGGGCGGGSAKRQLTDSVASQDPYRSAPAFYLSYFSPSPTPTPNTTPTWGASPLPAPSPTPALGPSPWDDTSSRPAVFRTGTISSSFPSSNYGLATPTPSTPSLSPSQEEDPLLTSLCASRLSSAPSLPAAGFLTAEQRNALEELRVGWKAIHMQEKAAEEAAARRSARVCIPSETILTLKEMLIKAEEQRWDKQGWRGQMQAQNLLALQKRWEQSLASRSP